MNKVFKKTHSRREADKLLESGRIEVNGKRVMQKGGFLVVPYVDEVKLDGKVVEGWEEMNGLQRPPANGGKNVRISSPNNQSTRKRDEQKQPTQAVSTKQFQYIKYWKPRGEIGRAHV